MNKIILFLLCMVSMHCYSQKTFTLTSADIGGQATLTEVFNGFGCTGKNQSPQLAWTNAPAGTKSFAVTMFDPDAPTGSGWWHWLIFDIPATTTQLVSNAGNSSLALAPKNAIQSVTNFETKGYGGPCPPENHGLHQYIITLYALKTDKLGLDANATPATVGYYLWNNTIEKASLIMYYQRKK